MKKKLPIKKSCVSPLHSARIRAVLILAAMSIFTLSLAFTLGFEYFSYLLEVIPVTFRYLFGLMYMILSLFILYYIFSYHKIRREQAMVCRHCGHAATQD